MKRFSEQLKKKSETVRMSAAERRDLKVRLVSYMEYHPLPKTRAQQNAESYLESESVFSFINFNTPHVRGFMTMFAAFVLIIVPIVAEKSVPGDILYPVKVNFTEEIRSTLTVSPYAKIELETRLLERRIAEARLLANEGKLTPEVEEEVAAAVKTHSDAAQSEIAMLRESDSDEAAIAEIAFGSALTVQSEVLEGTMKKVAAATGATTTADGALSLVVAEARKGVEENQTKQNPSFEKMMARIESETTRAYELFVGVKEVATEEEMTDVERRLGDIERKIADAVALHAEEVVEPEEGAEPAPRAEVALLRTALGDLQKLISFMTDIDVRENVTVDALVPVTPTDDEMRTELTLAYKTIEDRIETYETVLATDTSITQAEKIEVGLARAAEYASSSKASLEAGAFEAAIVAVGEATAYLDDIEKMITIPEVEPTLPEEKATTTEEAAEETGEETAEETDTEEVFDGEVTVEGDRATATIEAENNLN